MTKDNRTLPKTKEEFTNIGTLIIYETVSMECVVADVDPRIIAEMKRKLRGE